MNATTIAFTSAPRVRRFRDVARALEELWVQVNVKPQGDTFFMKPLVRELAVALTKE
ncbi:MAG: hypothetical protein WBE89_12135 [Methyloceanibacter sp.]